MEIISIPTLVGPEGPNRFFPKATDGSTPRLVEESDPISTKAFGKAFFASAQRACEGAKDFERQIVQGLRIRAISFFISS